MSTRHRTRHAARHANERARGEGAGGGGGGGEQAAAVAAESGELTPVSPGSGDGSRRWQMDESRKWSKQEGAEDAKAGDPSPAVWQIDGSHDDVPDGNGEPHDCTYAAGCTGDTLCAAHKHSGKTLSQRATLEMGQRVAEADTAAAGAGATSVVDEAVAEAAEAEAAEAEDAAELGNEEAVTPELEDGRPEEDGVAEEAFGSPLGAEASALLDGLDDLILGSDSDSDSDSDSMGGDD